MKETYRASALLDTVKKRKDAKEKAGETIEGNLVLQLVADELRTWSDDDLFALYTDFESPSVDSQLMEEYDFSEYHNAIALMRFAIGLQIIDLMKSFFPDPEHSTVFTDTISYVQQNLLDLAEYVKSQTHKDGLQEGERTLLMEIVEESLHGAIYNIDLENIKS